MALLFLLLACFDTGHSPEAKTARGRCYQLRAEVPLDCWTAASTALDAGDVETASFGLSIACEAGEVAACASATRLVKLGMSPTQAADVVRSACLRGRHASACTAWLELVGKDADPLLLEQARSVVEAAPHD